VGVAPHAIADLALQVGAFALLYLASGLTLVALRPDPWLVRTPLVPAQRVVATMVMVLGDGLLAWTLIVFGSWRLLARIEPTHRLVTTGPFGLVRHPNYLALILLALGTFLWIPTPWVLVAFVGVVLTSERRARAEERLLEETFGERYRAYLGRVRRWLPGLY
jgi:protein-S-isoprenylcysteine O-methyltransferase Ste14